MPSYAAPFPANCPEDRFQQVVIHVARITGHRVAHFRPSQNKRGKWQTAVAADGAGYPDLTIAKGGEVMFWELKTNTGRQSPEQKEWQEVLGERYYLLRPKDWPEVCRLLGYRSAEDIYDHNTRSA